jgi:hypothetical protein
MSELQVNKISPQSGTAITLGDSGDTFTIPSGATFTNNGTATGFGISSANTPTFLATLSGDKGTYGAGATTKVQFDNEVIDTNSAYDPSTNYRFTVPSGFAGNYLISTGLNIQSTTNGRAVRVAIYKNGGQLYQGGYFLTSQYFQNDQPNVATVSGVVNLAVSDYIEIYGFMYDGGNHTFKSSTSFFSGFKLT